MTPAAAIRGVGYRLRDSVLLDDVGFDVRAGELLGVVGPNGAGKSTLLQLLAGDLHPSAGVIEIGGRDVAGLSLEELARARSVLPQHHLLRFAFRCLDVVMMGRHPHGGSEADAVRMAEEAMETTDTASLAHRLYPTLSGGEQTRVSMARVFAQETPLVLLDEPTASLDLRHQHLVMAALRGLVDAGASVVAVLHDINLAARFADRALILDRGSVRAVGTPEAVFRSDILGSVYGMAVDVVPHPGADYPLILPRGVETGG